LCRRRTAAPNRIDRWRLIRDISPALARQLAKFREPVGKGLVLPSRDVFALEDKISSIPASTEPSPEAGMNIMRKAVAKNDLAKLKNRRKRIKGDRSK
jgi:hypothetical protein